MVIHGRIVLGVKVSIHFLKGEGTQILCNSMVVDPDVKLLSDVRKISMRVPMKIPCTEVPSIPCSKCVMTQHELPATIAGISFNGNFQIGVDRPKTGVFNPARKSKIMVSLYEADLAVELRADPCDTEGARKREVSQVVDNACGRHYAVPLRDQVLVHGIR